MFRRWLAPPPRDRSKERPIGEPADQQGQATRLLQLARGGDAVAADELVPLVYDELRQLASQYLRDERHGHTLQPTALVNEAYLRLIGRTALGDGDRRHFLAVAAQTMRRVLVDSARKRGSVKRGGDGWVRVTLSSALRISEDTSLDLVELNDLMERLGELDSRVGQVVELRVFGGLALGEIASVLQVSDRTVDSDWFFARGWLSRELAGRARD